VILDLLTSQQEGKVQGPLWQLKAATATVKAVIPPAKVIETDLILNRAIVPLGLIELELMWRALNLLSVTLLPALYNTLAPSGGEPRCLNSIKVISLTLLLISLYHSRRC
jgi:hypothetical protein